MDKFAESLSDWIKSIIKTTFENLILIIEKDDGFPEMMNRKQCADFLNVNPLLFDEYRKLPNFPKQQPGTKWKKRAIKEWLKEKI